MEKPFRPAQHAAPAEERARNLSQKRGILHRVVAISKPLHKPFRMLIVVYRSVHTHRPISPGREDGEQKRTLRTDGAPVPCHPMCHARWKQRGRPSHELRNEVIEEVIPE